PRRLSRTRRKAVCRGDRFPSRGGIADRGAGGNRLVQPARRGLYRCGIEGHPRAQPRRGDRARVYDARMDPAGEPGVRSRAPGEAVQGRSDHRPASRMNSMAVIERESLLTLEAYTKERPAFRARVLEHKKPRTVHLGEHVTLLFEDELTISYQIQEMLRIEKTFDEAGIRDELDVYNPLVPDGANFKATMLIEYDSVEERRAALVRLKGIEDRIYVQVAGSPKVYAIADEDLERET